MAPELPTILLVDDEPPIRHALRRELRAKNVVVVEADSAKAAYALLDSPEAPTLSAAMLDYYMPSVDGITLARELRRRLPSLPIMLVTAGHLHNDERVKEALDEGILAGTLSKPWNRALLLDSVDRLIEGKALEEEED